MTIQVLVVDDSLSVRNALCSIIEAEPDMAVMGQAGDPYRAAEIIKTQIPDVILLDIEMPRMDGLTFLKRIMSQRPIPVVVCSTLVEEGSPAFLDALRSGAVDVVAKPKIANPKMFQEACINMADKVRAAAGARMARRAQAAPAPRPQAAATEGRNSPDLLLPYTRFRSMGVQDRIIAIGASTGGTQALEEVLRKLSPDLPGIVIVQHMPERFTRAFADRLNHTCQVEVREAQSGDEVRRGRVLIAPGGKHLLVKSRRPGYVVESVDGPLISRHRPSVDVMFRAVAGAAGPNALGIIMTGMGDDGAQGLLEMRQNGASTLGQNEASCVVYGMPAEAAKKGAVERETDLAGIASVIRNFGFANGGQTAKRA